MNINFFTPLPPLPTEIANHSALILPELAKRAPVRVWTAQAEFLSPPGVEVVRFDPEAMDWGRLHGAAVNFYNLGNHADFHQAIFEIARRVPGIAILHDTRLQHFFGRYLTTERSPRDYYMNLLRGHYGEAAVAEAGQYLAGKLPFDALVNRYPMTVPAIEESLAAVLHNPVEAEDLAGRTDLPVFDLPLAGAAPPRRARAAWRGDAPLRLIMFGHIGGNRRLPGILRAIAGLPDRDGVVLDVYGRLEFPAEAEQLIAGLGLQGIVHLHGFVDDAVLQDALHRADLAINLRYPSMGEASASQLRLWSAALPSLVTRTGWYATLPDSAVFFVEPEREIEDIQRHLRAIRQSPALFAAAGLRGRGLLERRHRPEHYAAGLLAIAARHEALHARRHAMSLGRAAGGRLLALTGGESALIPDLAADLASRIHDLVTPRDG